MAILNGMRKDWGLSESSWHCRGHSDDFLVLLGADMLNAGLALSQLPAELANWVKNSDLPPLTVIFAILVIYIFLGCVMDSLAMILLTIPIFTPL